MYSPIGKDVNYYSMSVKVDIDKNGDKFYANNARKVPLKFFDGNNVGKELEVN